MLYFILGQIKPNHASRIFGVTDFYEFLRLNSIGALDQRY